MSVEGTPFKCDICGAPMKERIVRQISVQLEPEAAGPDKFTQIVVQILAGGMETQVKTVPNFGPDNQPQGTSKVSEITKKPENFDVCMDCQVKYAREAIEQLEKELRVSSVHTIKVDPRA